MGAHAGGAHGGGATLTEAGAAAVAEFRAMQARFAQFLADETASGSSIGRANGGRKTG
ncbi:MAG: hypothetical protein WKG07_11160 [Hymenobacter sp.]